MNNENGEMSSLEFSCWAILLAGLFYFLDIWLTQEQQIHQIPTKPEKVIHSREDKAVLCTGWSECVKLSDVIVWEARGEPTEGKRLVANVVLNRVEHKRWPDNIYDVVEQPKQFSYIEDMHKQRKPSEKDWTAARVVAYNTLHGLVEDKSEGAVFYHEQSINPGWAKRVEFVTQVGSHKFYKL